MPKINNKNESLISSLYKGRKEEGKRKSTKVVKAKFIHSIYEKAHVAVRRESKTAAEPRGDHVNPSPSHQKKLVI